MAPPIRRAFVEQGSLFVEPNKTANSSRWPLPKRNPKIFRDRFRRTFGEQGTKNEGTAEGVSAWRFWTHMSGAADDRQQASPAGLGDRISGFLGAVWTRHMP